MMGLGWLLIPASGLLTAATLGLLLQNGRALALAADIPNERSLHQQPTPRVGGLAMMPWALLVGGLLMPAAWPLLALAAVLSTLSFFDDRHGLPVVVRLTGHLAAAALAAGWLMPTGPAWAWGLTVLALGWASNLYNFMDGADGLAGGMALLGFGSLALVAFGHDPALSALCASLALAALGFLRFNFPPARCFMGDAGSVPLGFLAASLGLWGAVRGVWPLWLPCWVFAPFWLDASVTLLRRAARGEKLWQAHREHYYQRLVRMGWSHRRLALAAYGLMAMCGVSAWGLKGAPSLLRWAAAASGLLCLLGLMVAIDLRWRVYREGEMGA